MKKYNVSPTKGIWIKLPDDEEVELFIKPISVFSMAKLPSESDITPTDGYNIFQEMLIDWKGIVDENGKPIKCTEESKKMIYEYDQELVAFAIEKSTDLREKVVGKEKELKNLKTSQPGEGTKQDK